MKSEAAWAAASRRAGTLFALSRESEAEDAALDAALAGEGGGAAWDDSLGFEALREFSSGVQVVGASQQEEFFRSPDEEEATATAAAADDSEAAAAAAAAATQLPTAEFIKFHTAGLQAVLSEGCLYGWHLWGAEAGARAQLVAAGDAAVEALLTPPRRGPDD